MTSTYQTARRLPCIQLSRLDQSLLPHQPEFFRKVCLWFLKFARISSEIQIIYLPFYKVVGSSKGVIFFLMCETCLCRLRSCLRLPAPIRQYKYNYNIYWRQKEEKENRFHRADQTVEPEVELEAV